MNKLFTVVLTFPDTGNTFDKDDLKDLIERDFEACDSKFMKVQVFDNKVENENINKSYTK